MKLLPKQISPFSLQRVSRLATRRFTEVASNEAIKEGTQEVTQDAKVPVLTGAQFALTHRLGIQAMPIKRLQLALQHPALLKTPSPTTEVEFMELIHTGRSVLTYFVMGYLHHRFPKLPKDSRELAKAIYTCDKNLAVLARSVGLEYALMLFEGCPRMVMPSVAECIERAAKEKKLNKKAMIKPAGLLADTFLALLGQLASMNLAAARHLLDAYLFTCTFDTTRLVKPKYPIVQLTQALLAKGLPEPVFRLKHESGRTSDSSMYIVGVHAGPEEGAEELAEGYGPSVNLAEHRAATEALRKMYLVDVHEAPRPSDALLHDNSGRPVITLEEIIQASTQL